MTRIPFDAPSRHDQPNVREMLEASIAETAFVPCDECNGTGEITVNDTPFHDDPYRVKEVTCPACDGEMMVQVDVEPAGMDDVDGDA